MIFERRYNLLEEQLIRVVDNDGHEQRVTLPGVLRMLGADQVVAFPALRPHQRHAWHAFLVQLAVIALQRAKRTELPGSEEEWRRSVRALTAELWPGDEPWSLVAPIGQPAFLQPPVWRGNMDAYSHTVMTPDTLDMLVTAKNHDLKASVIYAAQPDDWLFALLTLQTMEGYSGRKNFGIARMNGGLANRPGVAFEPDGGAGKCFVSEVRTMLEHWDYFLEHYTQWHPHGELGQALLWLEEWDGEKALALGALHPLFIEVCRRVRIASAGERLVAVSANSEKSRLAAKELKGNIGDPWMPIKKAAGEALTVSRKGFDYGLLSQLLAGEDYVPAFFQQKMPAATDGYMVLRGRALVRGQGKTEGYHERRVLVPKKIARLIASRSAEQRIAEIVKKRIEDVQNMRAKVLRPALFSLLQQGPKEINYGSPTTKSQVEPYLRVLEEQVDREFFPDLWLALEAEEEAEQQKRWIEWIQKLREWASDILRMAEHEVPQADMRRYRARVRAEGLLWGSLRKHFSDIIERSNQDE